MTKIMKMKTKKMKLTKNWPQLYEVSRLRTPNKIKQKSIELR